MMRSNVEMILNSILSRKPKEVQDRLLSFLSENERSRLLALPSFAEAVTMEGFDNGAMLEKVHWSWLLPTLKSYSEDEQSLMLSALDKASVRPLMQELKGTVETARTITSTGRSFLRQVLLNSLIGPHDRLIPVDYLPPSPLNRILYLSKQQLILVVDLLAMHDLHLELKQIVETKILKRIYSFLTEPQRKILKQVGARQEQQLLPRLGLDRWDLEELTLRNLLHRRGLQRLGLALSREDPALIWYICHQLDIGRGNSLFKLCVKEGSAHSAELAARQVDELLSQVVE